MVDTQHDRLGIVSICRALTRDFHEMSKYQLAPDHRTTAPAQCDAVTIASGLP